MNEKDIYSLVRSVSKTGGFGLAKEEADHLSKSLTSIEATKAYTHIRDEAQRLEVEWRKEFLDLFPQAVGYLPDSQDPEFDESNLFAVIDQSPTNQLPDPYYDTLEDFLEMARCLGVDLASLRKDGLSLKEYAISAGKNHMIKLIGVYTASHI